MLSNKKIHTSETLCIQCQGWGKVPYNKNIKEGKYVDCTTCKGELLIDTNKVANILGKCEYKDNKVANILGKCEYKDNTFESFL